MKQRVYSMSSELKFREILDDSRLGEYQDSIKSYGEKARQTLGKFTRNDKGELRGSNPFMVVDMAQKGLLPEGIDSIATRLDLEEGLRYATEQENPNFLRGTYNDFGLALRLNQDSTPKNEYLAKRLGEQLKQKEIPLGTGKLIQIPYLSINEDPESSYGISFDLNDLATKETILDLDSLSWDWPLDNGLARAYLNDAQYWCSDGEYLGVSDALGAVVGVGVDAPKNLMLSKEELKDAFEKAGIPANYDLVIQQLQ